MDMIKSKAGELLSNQDEIQKRWKESFHEVLNYPASNDTGEFDEDDGIAVDAPIKAKKFCCAQRDEEWSSWGVNSVTIEILKADLATSVQILHYFLHKVWEQEHLPEDWRFGLVVKLPR